MQRQAASISARRATLVRGWDWAALRSRSLREAHRLVPGADAEEAVQEALIRAWTRRGACRPPEITRNESRRLLARRTRRQHATSSEPTAGEAEIEDDELANATTRVTVEQALARLEDSDRRVLRLRYADDLTQADVARRLGVPEGTVKVRLHRARGRLRMLLEDGR
jgi:RNA polymerase sigma-70 factor, ECF subfamily